MRFNRSAFRENNYNIRDIATIVKGKHIIIAGLEFTRHSNFTTNSAHSRGEFTFSGTYTGNAWADYLLGLPSLGSRSFPRDEFGYYMTEIEPFVQDNWKVTEHLTLNVGSRYSLFPQPVAMHNVLSSVNPLTNQIVVASDSQGPHPDGRSTGCSICHSFVRRHDRPVFSSRPGQHATPPE